MRKPFARRAAVGPQHAGLDREHVERRRRPDGRSPRAPPARGARASSRGSARRSARARRGPSAASRDPSARARRRRRPSSRPRGRAARSRRRVSIRPRPSRSHWTPAPPTRTAPSAANCRRRPGRNRGGRLQQPLRHRPCELADVREHEGPGAVRRLHLARCEAALAEQRRLLVAGDARERNGRPEQRRLGDDPGRGHDRRQDGAVDGEELEQLVVPAARPRGRGASCATRS